MNIPFKANGKYTLVTIARMAVTIRTEITIVSIDQESGKVMFKRKGERNLYPLDHDMAKTLVFDGHNLPFKLGSETGNFRSVSGFDFRGENPEELKTLITEKCLNSDAEKLGKILISTSVDGPMDYLFPEEQTH